MFVYMCAHIHTKAKEYTCKHIQISIIHTHGLCTHICRHMGMLKFTHTKVYTFAQTQLDEHIHIQKHIHTHIHTKLQGGRLFTETTPTPALGCPWAQLSPSPFFSWNPAGTFQTFPVTSGCSSTCGFILCLILLVSPYAWIYWKNCKSYSTHI